MTNTDPAPFEWFYQDGSYCFAEECAYWECATWWYDPARHEITHIEYDTFADRGEYITTRNAELSDAVYEVHRPALHKLLTVLSTIYP